MMRAAIATEKTMNYNPVITKTQSLKAFIGSVVGYIQINKNWIHHNSSFECAAWWEDSQIEGGVYPLALMESRYAPYDLYLSAKLNAVVVDDFFPALWAGSPISNTRSPKNVGGHRHIFHRVDIVDAIDRTGHSPGSDIDYCVHPFMVDAFIDAARDSMSSYQSLMNEYWNTYQKEGDGNYCSNLSMVSHCAANVAALGKAIQTMLRRQENFNQSSDYMRQLYANNTSWAADQ
jgi:hypothetical protein